ALDEAGGGRPGEPAPGDDASVGGLRQIQLVGGGMIHADDDTPSRETLLRIDFLEDHVKYIWATLEEKDTEGKPSIECCEELKEQLVKLERRVWDMEHRLANIEKKLSGQTAQRRWDHFEKGEKVDFVDPAKFNKLQGKNEELSEQIRNIQAATTQQIENVQEQANDIERELGLLVERVNAGAVGAEGFAQDFSGMNELYNKIQMIQCDMEIISNTSARLMEERDERANQLQSLAVQLETLRNIKADREELDEALLDKADQIAVNRKVSHDQFDSALEDLSRGLEDAVTKLTQQEALWQQALDEIQNEIGNKLDRQEMGPLKEFVNKKLKMLHERLKNLAKVRKQAEAAGTKKKLFTDVNCISCDVDAVMKTELEGNVPIPPALPPHRSMKPFLTYELDMIRKEHKKFPPKNLVRLEEALINEQKSKTRTVEGKTSIGKRDHLCNRYCGGSHTTTTPYQRVTRVGHFVTCQGTGLEAVQLSPERCQPVQDTSGKADKGDTKRHSQPTKPNKK
ncbi:Glutamine-rich protein 2, partial [Gryllus bimaculatus]